MLAQFLDISDEMPGGVFFQTCVGRAPARTALIEEHNPVSLRIKELAIFWNQAAARPAVQKHHRLSFRIPALLVIKLVNVRHFQTASVIGFDWIVENSKFCHAYIITA